MPDDSKPQIRRNEVEATQGSKAPKMIYVLAASKFLAIVAVAIVWVNSR